MALFVLDLERPPRLCSRLPPRGSWAPGLGTASGGQASGGGEDVESGRQCGGTAVVRAARALVGAGALGSGRRGGAGAPGSRARRGGRPALRGPQREAARLPRGLP